MSRAAAVAAPLRHLTASPWRLAIALVLLVAVAFPLAGQAVVDSGEAGRQWDPRVEMQVAQRVGDFGGPYYETGSDQKGPLWIGAYRIATALGGQYNQWLVYGFLVVALQCLIALALVGLGRAAPRGADEPAWTSRSTVLLTGAGIAALSILVFSGREWAQGLYSRNIVALLMAGALLTLVALPGRTPRARRGRAALAGALAGLAVQTNPASALTALVLAGLLLWLGVRGPRAEEPRVLGGRLPEAFAIYAVTGVLALLSALLWYAVRGGLSDFWDQWWTYNQHYTSATGTSLGDGISLAWENLRLFFRAQTGLLGIVAATIVLVVVRRRRRHPVWLEVTLLAWLAAELVAVAAAQRYFDHYFVLVFVPILAMGVVLAVRLADALDGVGAPVAAVAIAAVAVVGPGSVTLGTAWEAAKDAPTPGDVLVRNLPAPGGEQAQLRQAARQYLDGNRYAVAWLQNPSSYDVTGTTSATRYPESRWMVGLIYGDPAAKPFNPKYVLPDTYDNWAADIRQTAPNVWIDTTTEEPPAGSPYRRFRDCAYRLRWQGPRGDGSVQRVYARAKPVGACLPGEAADSAWNGGAAQ